MAIDTGWRTLRERQQQDGTKAVFDETPICHLCNDHGYVTLIYPTKYSAIRPCNCSAAHSRFGSDTFEVERYVDPKDYWEEQKMYFGCRNPQETEAIMKQYQLVELPRKHPKAERVFEYRRKDTE